MNRKNILNLIILFQFSLLLLSRQVAGQDSSNQEKGKNTEQKKTSGFYLRLQKKWPSDSCAGHWFFSAGFGTGTGYVSGKVYEDNPKTPDDKNDGPTIRNNTTDTGPIARWSAGYVLKRGLGFGVFARLQITNGSTPGYDTKFDAWIIGLRILHLVYVKGKLNVLPFLGFGYGMMRHIIRDAILPKGESGDFYHPSGRFDFSLGVQIVHRFTPFFNLFIDLVGDVMFPAVAVNLDAVIGIGLSY